MYSIYIRNLDGECRRLDCNLSSKKNNNCIEISKCFYKGTISIIKDLVCDLVKFIITHRGNRESMIRKFGEDFYKNLPNDNKVRNIRHYVERNIYILGVKYKFKKYNDAQVCITGHPKKGEIDDVGASREIEEELGLKINIHSKFNKKVVIRQDKDLIHSDKFYTIPLSEASLSEDINEDCADDNSLRHFIIIIYGCSENIESYMDSDVVSNIKSDCIDAVWAAPIDLINGIYEKISDGGRDEFPYKNTKTCYIKFS